MSEITLMAAIDMNTDTIALAAIIAGAVVLVLMILVGLPVWLGVRQSRFDRQLKHAETMKALELGITSPDAAERDSEWSPMRVCAAIGVWVPVAVFGATLLAAVFGHVPHEIWYAATGIGMAGIICGTVLMIRLPAVAAVRDDRPAGGRPAAPKAVVDADAYDTASRRG